MIDWEKLMSLKQALDKANTDLDKALEEVWWNVEDRATMTTITNRWRQTRFNHGDRPPIVLQPPYYAKKE